MKDKSDVVRGRCTGCENQCFDFLVDTHTDDCGFCFCSSSAHIAVEMSPELRLLYDVYQAFPLSDAVSASLEASTALNLD
eukprot:gene9306-8362_t